MDVMIDMETMSSRNNAAIATLGAVAFNPDIITPLGEMDSRNFFNGYLDLRKQEGRHFDGDTIYWWLQQSLEARVALRPKFNVQPDEPRRVLQQFSDWCYTVGAKRCWSYGATFDNVLLVDIYRWVGLNCPIHYRDQACARTVIQLASLPRPQVAGLVAHGALDDAIVQTIWLQQSLTKLSGNAPKTNII